MATGGEAILGARPSGEAMPLLATVPALHPQDLGDASFRTAHGVRYCYVAGAMANGIASVELVVAMGRAGMLGFFGAAGLAPGETDAAVGRIRDALGDDAPWGVNLIHSPSEPEIEAATVQVLLDRAVRTVSASAYLGLTLPLVRYRLHGIHRGEDGAVVTPNKVLAKVSRTEVAAAFMAPAPARLVAQLVEAGELTPEQAELAALVPVAEDITAEADSGGHTDNRPLVVLLPRLCALRDAVQAEHGYSVRVGAAGGLGTPGAIASAFGLGAAYVVTGSVNQACVEAGTSDRVRQLLAQARTTDVTMAPAADMFEMGVELQVLSRGTLFPVRARKLYEIYKRASGLAQLSPAEVADLEKSVFRRSLDEAWADTAAFWAERDPTQLRKAEADPKHKMALLFRSYLGLSSRWANAGHDERVADYQVWCGPSMGAFNDWAAGGRFGAWQERAVVPVARCLLVGAAVATRAAALRAQGVQVPSAAEACEALSDSALDALLEREWAPRDLEPRELRESRTSAQAPVADAAGRRGEPIAIVGMACLFPQAEDLTAFRRNLRRGVDAITEVPDRPGYWRKEDYLDADPKAPDMLYTARGGFIDPVAFDPTEFGIPPTILEATDTSQLLGLFVAARALEDAGYGASVEWDKDRASVILGVTGTQELVVNLGARLGHPKWRRALREAGVDEETTEDVVQRIAASYVSWQENSFPGLLGNVVAGRIANRLDLGGTNCVIDAACASSLGAVEMAVMELRSGRSDLVVTGGVDTLNDVFMYQCFTATPALSKTGDSRPFDKDGDGTILGEGIGIVVLKRLADAERDGDRVHAVLRGIGSSSDGRARSIYAPRSSGQARAVRDAHRDAGVTPADIGLVEAHGTGTKAGDGTELEGLESVFVRGELPAQSVAVGSVKSMIGHAKAAAGAAGLIKAAVAVRDKVLPPTLKVREPLAALADGASPLALNTEARPWISGGKPRIAGVSAFGFGGSNFHAILEEVGRDRATPAWDGAVELIAASGADAEALSAALREIAAADGELRAVARASRARFRRRAARAVLVVEAGDDWRAVVLRAAERAAAGVASTSPDGVALGFGDAGALAFVFSGQGSQRPGMGAELACVFPEVLDELEAQPALAAVMHPPKAWTPQGQEAQVAALRRTDKAQPALGALESGLLDLLARFGVRPDMVAGHSFGEVVALHAAGALDRASLRSVATTRGRLMAGDGEDRGTMLALLGDRAAAEAAVAETDDVVLANLNAPGQVVASGTRGGIAALEATVVERGLRPRRLSVGAAFHSPLVADAVDAFAAELREVPVTAPRLPVYGNTTASPYGGDPDAVKAQLAGQLAAPVRWDASVEAMHAAGARTFLEVGPGAALTGLVGRVLGDTPHVAVAVDGNARRGGLWSLAFALAQVAAAGHPVELTAWEPEVETTRRTPRMQVPLGGANHREPVTPIPPRAPRPVAAAPARVPSQAAAHATPSPSRPVAAPARPSVAPSRHAAPPTPPRGAVMSNDDPRNQLLAQALHGAQEHLRALQAMQQQTAETHRAFLAGQAAAQSSFQELLDGQQRLLEQLMGLPPRPTVTRAAAPSPLVSPAVPAAPAMPVAPPPTFAAPAITPPATYSAPVPVPAAPVAAPRVAPPVAPAPAPTAAPAAPVDVVGTLLAVVAEATGYPVDMLELDMDLESDLGIDSIKRVEILSLLTERLPNAPTVEPEQLGSLHTLRQVADFVGMSEGTPTPVTGAAPSATVPAPAASSASGASAPPAPADAAAVLLAVVAESTGYPTDMLELDMDMESDLGIDSIKRVEILSLLSDRLPDAPVVEPEALGGLHTLRQVLDFVAGGSGAEGASESVPSPAVDPIEEQTARHEPEPVAPERRAVSTVPFADAAADRPLPLLPGSAVWVLDDGTDLSQVLCERLSAEGLDAHLVHAHSDAVPRPAGLVLLGNDLPLAFSILRTAGPHLASAGGMLLSVSRLDGGFASLDGSVFTAADGVSAGLVGFVKTAAWEWPELWCRALDVSAALEDEEAVVDLVARELRSAGPLEIGYDAHGRRRRVVLTPVEDGDSPETRAVDGLVVVTGGARGVTADCAVALAEAGAPALLLLGRSPLPDAEPDWLVDVPDDGLQAALLAHGFDGRPSPKELRERVRSTLGAREIRTTLQRLEDAGAAVVYASVDARDGDAVAKAIRKAERTLKVKAKGLVHGAGVLRDKLITDKSDDDVALVLGTKLDGLRACLGALSGRELTFVGLFGSVTGRFGRRGQADYAAANRVLDALAAREAARRSEARVVCFSWGPWDGGMVTPALKKAFAAEGVALIPRGPGARLCAETLLQPSGAPLLVVGDGLDSGAGSPEPVSHSRPLVLSAERWPVLADHELEGVPVLPMALAMELLGREALREVPGMRLAGLDDVRVLKGVRLDGPVALTPRVSPPVVNDAQTSVTVELVDDEGRARVRGIAVLQPLEAEREAPPAAGEVPDAARSLSVEPYGRTLFHGPAFRCLSDVEGVWETGIAARVTTTPAPREWLPGTAGATWAVDPLAIDGVFQAMILWCVEQIGAPSLPSRVARLRLYGELAGELRVVATVRRRRGANVLCDVDLVGEHGVVARIDGYTCTASPTLTAAFASPERPAARA